MATPGRNAASQLPGRQSSYNYDELIACGHGELFGPTNGRLPMPNMLMTDRISWIAAEGGKYGRGEMKAELDIRPDLWFFDCHFESDPVMPGCLGLASSIARPIGASSFSTKSGGALPHTMGYPSPGRSLSTYMRKLVRRRSSPLTITS